jgi:hypothetical protein
LDLVIFVPRAGTNKNAQVAIAEALDAKSAKEGPILA